MITGTAVLADGGGGQHCVIALDFPLEFAGLFPRKKYQKTRGKFVAFRGNSGKKYRIFSLLFSSETAFYPIPTNVYVSTRTSPPPARAAPPGPPPPGPPHPAASTRPAPARPASSATCNRIFSSVPNFSLMLLDFSLVQEQDFSLVPELTYCVDATLPRRAEQCALACC